MAGEVRSRNVMKKFLSFWHRQSPISQISFASLLILFFAGCQAKPFGEFSPNINAQQKKVELRKSLDRYYEDERAHFLLGQLYHAERNYADAEFHYNAALRFDPVYRSAQAAMMKLLLDRGETTKAAHYLDSYMNQVKGSPNKMCELGLEFQEQRLDSYALDCFNQALELAPNSDKVHRYLGYFYLSRNDKVKAEEHFATSFQINPDQPDVSFELGRLHVPVVIDSQIPGQTTGTH